ncbi:hypothetical protein KCP75_10585 [Salmonella enterica subsp. enterica]|nr:hypothetical protein KCP75_10585 [Salmonella enterica subsp. enterica]
MSGRGRLGVWKELEDWLHNLRTASVDILLRLAGWVELWTHPGRSLPEKPRRMVSLQGPITLHLEGAGGAVPSCYRRQKKGAHHNRRHAGASSPQHVLSRSQRGALLRECGATAFSVTHRTAAAKGRPSTVAVAP